MSTPAAPSRPLVIPETFDGASNDSQWEQWFSPKSTIGMRLYRVPNEKIQHQRNELDTKLVQQNERRQMLISFQEKDLMVMGGAVFLFRCSKTVHHEMHTGLIAGKVMFAYQFQA